MNEEVKCMQRIKAIEMTEKKESGKIRVGTFTHTKNDSA